MRLNICNGAKQIYKETKKDSKKRTLPISEAAVQKCSVKKEKNVKNSQQSSTGTGTGTGTGVFLWILQNLYEQLICRTSENSCFLNILNNQPKVIKG